MSMTFSALDLSKVKEAAKKNKAAFPNSGHRHLLDHFARELFGVRSFYELQAGHKRTVDQQVTSKFGASHCAYCDFTFDRQHKPDQKFHLQFHSELELAVAKFGFKPDGYSEREAKKKQAYDQIYSDEKDAKLAGAILLLKAWFDRSVISAVKGQYWKQHPNFEKYVAFFTGHSGFLTTEIRSALIEKYGREDGVIPDGQTNWHPISNH